MFVTSAIPPILFAPVVAMASSVNPPQCPTFTPLNMSSFKSSPFTAIMLHRGCEGHWGTDFYTYDTIAWHIVQEEGREKAEVFASHLELVWPFITEDIHSSQVVAALTFNYNPSPSNTNISTTAIKNFELASYTESNNESGNAASTDSAGIMIRLPADQVDLVISQLPYRHSLQMHLTRPITVEPRGSQNNISIVSSSKVTISGDYFQEAYFYIDASLVHFDNIESVSLKGLIKGNVTGSIKAVQVDMTIEGLADWTVESKEGILQINSEHQNVHSSGCANVNFMDFEGVQGKFPSTTRCIETAVPVNISQLPCTTENEFGMSGIVVCSSDNGDTYSGAKMCRVPSAKRLRGRADVLIGYCRGTLLDEIGSCISLERGANLSFAAYYAAGKVYRSLLRKQLGRAPPSITQRTS